MRYYERIYKSEGIYSTKSNRSKECKICHHGFFNHEFKFQHSICNGCPDLTILSLNIGYSAIISVKNVHYRCINICKSEAVNILKNFVLKDCVYM